MTDTPGLMWPKIGHPDDGCMLAASHIIGTNAYIESEVATFLAETLITQYPKALHTRYATPADGQGMDGTGVIEAVAARRGFRIKGGEFGLEKAAITLLNDYRSGALGRISLETPASRAARSQVAGNNDALPESADDPDSAET
jgi:ribosome biogenesis GTPase A